MKIAVVGCGTMGRVHGAEPAVIRTKEAIERGDIGEVVAVKGTNRGTMPGGWFVDPALSGGGALLDHTVHVMDLLGPTECVLPRWR